MAARMSSHSKRRVKRRLVLKQDHRCWICGVRRSIQTFTLDHIIPRRFKELTHNKESNLKLACFSCNSNRGDAVDRLLTPGFYRKTVLTIL